MGKHSATRKSATRAPTEYPERRFALPAHQFGARGVTGSSKRSSPTLTVGLVGQHAAGNSRFCVARQIAALCLLAPHLKGTGQNNSARWHSVGGRKLIHAQREGIHLVLGCGPDFTRRSVGYVGASDGWQDLMDNFQMDWEFHAAEDGNIALTGEIDLSHGRAIHARDCVRRQLPERRREAAAIACRRRSSMHREGYVRQMAARSSIRNTISAHHTCDGGGMYRLSRCVLLAHEDKVFQGALVASMSIPWGETKGDKDLGGYHLVWTRDLVQSATALLATGQTERLARLDLAGVPFRGRMEVSRKIAGSMASAYWPGCNSMKLPRRSCWRGVCIREGVTLGLFDPWRHDLARGGLSHSARTGDRHRNAGRKTPAIRLRRSPR